MYRNCNHSVARAKSLVNKYQSLASTKPNLLEINTKANALNKFDGMTLDEIN